MAEVFDLYGEKLDDAELPANDREAMAQIFEDLAQQARDGMIENFITVMMRSQVNYATVSWNTDTLRLIGALEAAKLDLFSHDQMRTDDENVG